MVAVHGRAAVPPYAGWKVVLTRPAGTTTDAGTTTHPVSDELRATLMFDGAAIGTPPLPRRTVRDGAGSAS